MRAHATCKFWCIFEFFAPRRRLYGLGFIQLVVTLRSKKDARASLGFKCFVSTPECLLLTRESYNKIRIETREKKKHTCRLASSIIPSGID